MSSINSLYSETTSQPFEGYRPPVRSSSRFLMRCSSAATSASIGTLEPFTLGPLGCTAAARFQGLSEEGMGVLS